MRFLANENMPLPSVKRLREAQHDVTAVAETAPGAKDADIMALAAREGRVILTFDRDYGELIYRLALAAPLGIVYFRLHPSSPQEPADLLLQLLADGKLPLEHKFTVVERSTVRQRPLPTRE